MEIKIARKMLRANDEVAEANRRALAEAGVAAVNILGSPGAGKTALVERTVSALKGELVIGVIEGDIATARDAERVAAAGAKAVQLSTGGACHMNAGMVAQGMEEFDLGELDLLLVENVGNLVCTAPFDLGEARKVLVASTPEGDDKPAKYPAIFMRSHAVVINKVDLAEVAGCDVSRIRREALELNPELDLFEVSCRTGDGLDGWLDWLRDLAAASS
jgi:hydrogenase nickel incorporation protein HypB